MFFLWTAGASHVVKKGHFVEGKTEVAYLLLIYVNGISLLSVKKDVL